MLTYFLILSIRLQPGIIPVKLSRETGRYVRRVFCSRVGKKNTRHEKNFVTFSELSTRSIYLMFRQTLLKLQLLQLQKVIYGGSKICYTVMSCEVLEGAALRVSLELGIEKVLICRRNGAIISSFHDKGGRVCRKVELSPI